MNDSMKNFFNPADAAAALARIQALTPGAKPQWGKMNASQMLAHMNIAMSVALGDHKPKRLFIGYLIGRIAKRSLLNDKPFMKGAPTDPAWKCEGQYNFDEQKSQLIHYVQRISSGGASALTNHPHPFFGRLTPSEWSQGMYKHLDHHLRQFNV
ncbi:uncharacterized protein DUF1569 [Chitinophaga skermanii]|uniref:Uncharacterized protein DUF1569 n=2 Tax=Chitinophaga skermanii TaxID=331697 RepID=A0A327QD08_9BACT|nr:uncharacterized protein DUF1569 [Chitinophaga skermanii]